MRTLPPPGWAWSKVKHLADFFTGWTPPTGDAASFEGDNLWANISDLGERVLVDTAKRISDEAIRQSAIQVSPAGSLLFSFKLSIGQVSFAGCDLYTNEAIATFPPVRGFNPRWAYWAFPVFVPLNANENIYGAKLLNQELIRAADVLVPPENEQERIANFLDEQTARIDALIAEKEQLLERLCEYSAAYANEVFRDSLAVRGGVRLKYRCPEVTVGIVVTPAKYYVETGVPCLRSLNVGEGYLIAENLVHISPEANELHAKSKIFAGDIVVVRSGKTGATAVVTPDFDGANCIDLVIIRSSPQVDSEWLRVYLNSTPALEQVTDASEGAIQQHFNVGSARELRIPDSSLGEQRQDLARVLRVERATSELAAHVKGHIERLREYRASLISAAVTGQLDVSVPCERTLLAA